MLTEAEMMSEAEILDRVRVWLEKEIERAELGAEVTKTKFMFEGKTRAEWDYLLNAMKQDVKDLKSGRLKSRRINA